ncbi:hypothetical protein OEA_13130 [Priestia megaterium NCT-2]|uniref:hypothetical protein n=1 Tax=Priestia megaterium TaxID=1404 RepID=UPI001013C9D3|nr:hypothetical protein [Priestia megaterium]AYE50682.2 hypothetical protein OEA_13130 [Priestia megaterium NCT-2]
MMIITNILLMLLVVVLFATSLYFILWLPINQESDSNTKLALFLNIIAFGTLFALPFILNPNKNFNGLFWINFTSFIIILVMLLVIKIKTKKKWTSFVELALKLFEIHTIVLVILFIKSSVRITELINALPNFITHIPTKTAIFLYIIFGILKIMDTLLTFNNYFEQENK